MRNTENPFCDESLDEDTDILCRSKEQLCDILALEPVSNTSVYNYYTLIDGKRVRIDIREIGDGYYDDRWEELLLSRRIMQNGVYVLGEEDYYYTILYHVLIHKHEISGKYVDLLHTYRYGRTIYVEMRDYLKRNRIRIIRPKDKGVSFNKKNYYILKALMCL